MKEDKYLINGLELVKRFDGGRIVFLCNGKEVDIIKWNEILNENQPMELVREHKNPVIRAKEEKRIEKIIECIGKQRNVTVADLGCEKGELAKRISLMYEDILCCDIDVNVLNDARNNISNNNVKYFACDICETGLLDNTVDICIASEVIEHLPEPEKAVSELARITKPGGRVIISVPNEKVVLSLKNIAKMIGMRKSLGALSEGIAVGHVQIFGMRKLKNVLSKHIEIENMFYCPPFFLNIIAVGKPKKITS